MLWTLGCDANDPHLLAAFWARAKVADLLEAGATQVREEFCDGTTLGHVVLLDPEGNEFCVT